MQPITPKVAATVVAYVAEGESFARAAGLIRSQLVAIRPFSDRHLSQCLDVCDRLAGRSSDRQADALARLTAHAATAGQSN